MGLGILIVPPLLEQSVRLAQNLLPPEGRYYVLLTELIDYIEKKTRRGEIPSFVNEAVHNVMNQLGQTLMHTLRSALSTLGSLFSLILLPFITYYALQIVDPLRERIRWWVPEQYRQAAGELIRQTGQLVGRYIRGYLLLCLLVGLTDTIFLYACRSFFGIDYILTVGILAGAAYAIPYFGMVLVTMVGGVVAWTTAVHNPTAATLVTVLGLSGVNQFYDWVVLPRVVGQAVRLHPLTVIFAVMSGGAAFGLIGMLLAVPFAGAVKLVLVHLFPAHFGKITEKGDRENDTINGKREG